MSPARWALFISGQGTNMSVLLDQKWDLDVALVVSSKESAPGLKRARRAGVKTVVFSFPADWSRVVEELKKQRITHIFLLGFMKIVPSDFLKQWSQPILNIHPSLLPQFPGLDSVRRAYETSCAVGATVHHVTDVVDAGAIVLQKTSVSKEDIKKLSLDLVEKKNHRTEYFLVRQAVEKKYA